MLKSMGILPLTCVGARLLSQLCKEKHFSATYLGVENYTSCTWGNAEPKRNMLAIGKYLIILL